MTTLWERVHSLLLLTNRRLLVFPGREKQLVSRFARSLVASLMGVLLVTGPLSPAFAQNPAPNPAPAASVATAGSSIAPVSSLGLAKYDFTKGPRAFPNLLKPYQQIRVDEPVITNSPRLQQLIHDGKLELSLQDAVELALENSMDIAVQRYYP